jgi:hypothetical protein
MNIVNYVTENWAQILEAILGIVGVFSIIATMTPNKADDQIVSFVLKAVNFLGGNVGKSTNK